MKHNKENEEIKKIWDYLRYLDGRITHIQSMIKVDREGG